MRANQKSAIGLGDGNYTGVLTVLATIADAKKLTFTATVSYTDGTAAVKTFTPCSDDGVVKKFTDLDDIMKWLTGAFLDFTQVNISFANASLIAKAFVPPTDPVANATKQKAAFTKLKDGIQDNKTTANGKVDAAVASGWNTSPYPALVNAYNTLVANRDAVLAIEAYYTAQITYWDGIANP